MGAASVVVEIGSIADEIGAELAGVGHSGRALIAEIIVRVALILLGGKIIVEIVVGIGQVLISLVLRSKTALGHSLPIRPLSPARPLAKLLLPRKRARLRHFELFRDRGLEPSSRAE